MGRIADQLDAFRMRLARFRGDVEATDIEFGDYYRAWHAQGSNPPLNVSGVLKNVGSAFVLPLLATKLDTILNSGAGVREIKNNPGHR
jgi:hypothetical protein